ncbi:MAG: translocation/assembly module TamB domain-containing protein, partial [Oligoflexia bacterium]|nr:translocation/assembly module TamB domain-containing protein [Oligoflexia bacterium]
YLEGGLRHFDDKVDGEIKLNISDLVIDNKKFNSASLDFKIGKQSKLFFNLFDSQLVGDLSTEKYRKFVFNADFNNLDLYSLVTLFLPKVNVFSTKIDGHAGMTFDLNGVVDSYRLELGRFQYGTGRFSLKNEGKIEVLFNNESYKVKPFRIISTADENTCSLSVSNTESGIGINGCLGADIFSAYNAYISNSRGKLNLDLDYSDTLDGSVAFDQIEMTPGRHKLGIIALNGKVSIENDTANLDLLTIETGGGSIDLGGKVNLTNIIKLKGIYPDVDVNAVFDKISFEYPEGLRGKWSGELFLKGKEKPYRLSGSMALFDGNYRKDIEADKIGFKKDNKEYLPVPSLLMDETRLFDFNVGFKSDIGDVLVKNDAFAGNIKFELELLGNEETPRLKGTVSVLRGEITYRDIVFEVTSGRMKFSGDTLQSYSYQLDSEARIGDYQVILQILGDSNDIKFRLSSLPPLNEDEIVSLMATGEAQTELTTREKQYNITVGEGSRIVTGSLGVAGAIKDNTGVNVKLKYSNTEDSTLPAIEVKKDITDKLKVTYGKSLDEDVNKQEINVQYEINKNVELDLLLKEEESEDVEKEPAKAGFDLKFKFEF